MNTFKLIIQGTGEIERFYNEAETNSWMAKNGYETVWDVYQRTGPGYETVRLVRLIPATPSMPAVFRGRGSHHTLTAT